MEASEVQVLQGRLAQIKLGFVTSVLNTVIWEPRTV